LLKNGNHQKGKHVNWIRAVGVKHLSAHMQDLPFLVQVFQIFVYSVAHFFISILIVYIFVDAVQE